MAGDNLNKEVLRELAKLDLTYVRPLGAGSYGDVILVKSAEEELAMKIVKKENYWMPEEMEWPNLKHPNILPLIGVHRMKRDTGILYIMPIVPRSLHDVLSSMEFPAAKSSFTRTKRWLKDILSGVNYLHRSSLCHLDIKTDNVLINQSDAALLCDFSGLSSTKFQINRLV